MSNDDLASLARELNRIAGILHRDLYRDTDARTLRKAAAALEATMPVRTAERLPAREDVSPMLYAALKRYASHTCPVHRNEPCGLCLALAEYESRA